MKGITASPGVASKPIGDDRTLRTILLTFCEVVGRLAGPAVVVFLPLCFNPYADSPFESAKVTFFRFAVGLFALAYAFRWFMARTRAEPSGSSLAKPAPIGHPLVLAVAVYGAVYVLATAFSVDPHRSFWGAAHRHGTFTVLCSLTFFFLLSTTLEDRRDVSRLVTALLLGSVPAVVYGLAQSLGADPLGWATDSVSPVLSTMGRSNFLGAYLAMVVPFTLLRGVGAARSSASSSWRLAVLGFLQVGCILLTQARAAWLALVAGAAVFAGLLAFRRQSRKAFALCTLVLLLGASVFMLLSVVNVSSLVGLSAPSRLSDRPFHQVRTATVESRLVIWRATLELIRERWPLGYGPENFEVVFNSSYPSETLWGMSGILVDDPHNLVLDLLTDVGVGGTAAFLAVVAGFFTVAGRELRRASDRYEEGLLAALMGSATAFLVQAQFNPDVIVTWALFWVVMAVAVAVPNAARAPSGR